MSVFSGRAYEPRIKYIIIIIISQIIVFLASLLIDLKSICIEAPFLSPIERFYDHYYLYRHHRQEVWYCGLKNFHKNHICTSIVFPQSGSLKPNVHEVSYKKLFVIVMQYLQNGYTPFVDFFENGPYCIILKWLNHSILPKNGVNICWWHINNIVASEYTRLDPRGVYVSFQ